MTEKVHYKKSVHGWVVLDEERERIGEVLRYTEDPTRTWWRVSGTTALWDSRRDAVDYLLMRREGFQS